MRADTKLIYSAHSLAHKHSHPYCRLRISQYIYTIFDLLMLLQCSSGFTKHRFVQQTAIFAIFLITKTITINGQKRKSHLQLPSFANAKQVYTLQVLFLLFLLFYYYQFHVILVIFLFNLSRLYLPFTDSYERTSVLKFNSSAQKKARKSLTKHLITAAEDSRHKSSKI